MTLPVQNVVSVFSVIAFVCSLFSCPCRSELQAATRLVSLAQCFQVLFDSEITAAVVSPPSMQISAVLAPVFSLIKNPLTHNVQVFGQKKVAGSIVGGRADMNAMLNVAALHGIKPMVETLPLSKVITGVLRFLCTSS